MPEFFLAPIFRKVFREGFRCLLFCARSFSREFSRVFSREFSGIFSREFSREFSRNFSREFSRRLRLSCRCFTICAYAGKGTCRAQLFRGQGSDRATTNRPTALLSQQVSPGVQPVSFACLHRRRPNGFLIRRQRVAVLCNQAVAGAHSVAGSHWVAARHWVPMGHSVVICQRPPASPEAFASQ